MACVFVSEVYMSMWYIVGGVCQGGCVEREVYMCGGLYER